MSTILKERTETLYYELEDYVKAFQKKAESAKEEAFKGKVDNIELFDEEQILETAYNIFSNQNLHHSDIHGMELRFTITFENAKLVEPETKFTEEIEGMYKLLVKKHLKNFYILDKEKKFVENSPERIQATKDRFVESIKSTNGLDYITAQLEKELTRKNE